MTEIWKVMFEKYEISSCGRIRNLTTNKTMKPHRTDDGYIRIKLSGHGTYYVHRLVALHFIENPNNFPTVDHIDRIRDNNNVENLRWASSKMQASNISEFGRLKRKVSKIDIESNEIISVHDSLKEAASQTPGGDGRLISATCRGKRKTHAGFKWKYMDIDELENEKWIRMEEYDGELYISDHGRIKFKDGRISTGSLSVYKRIHLKKDGNELHMQVHRLVAMHFLDNPDNFPIVNHKDGNKTNNHVDNLEWCSYSYNSIHAHQSGLVSKQKKENKTNKITNEITKQDKII